MPYTVIIPIHNEETNIPTLLEGMELYAKNHEILIIDDGSTDGSAQLLTDCSFINLIKLENNLGKGIAIRTGIENAKYDKIVITDGDLELDPKEINQLMILDKMTGIKCVFGSRYEDINPFESLWEFGNFFFTGLFNTVQGSNLSDALCCGKAFFKGDIKLDALQSTSFDIDVELASMLLKKLPAIEIIPLSYDRRKIHEGKKLRFKDGWKILIRILSG